MTDIETQVFQMVYDAVKAGYASADVTGVSTLSPTTFPCVSLVETDNSSYLRGEDSGGNIFARVTYQVNVFTDTKGKRKGDAKAILSLVDGVMTSAGFQRLSAIPVAFGEPDAYRIVATYAAIASEKNETYRR